MDGNTIKYKNLVFHEHPRLKDFNKGICLKDSDHIYVSPSIFSLLESDFEVTFNNLEVLNFDLVNEELEQDSREDIELAIDKLIAIILNHDQRKEKEFRHPESTG